MASSKDILIPSVPLSKKYNIVDGIDAHEQLISCHRETIRAANI